MNLLFLDDDPVRHQFFNDWLADATKPPSLSQRLLALWRRDRDEKTTPHFQVEAVFTVEAAIAALRDSERFEVAFLDHDLDGRTFVEEREGTGTEVAEFIAAMPPESRPRHIIVHSMNPEGARRMLDILLARGCYAEEMPFGSQNFLRCVRDLERAAGHFAP